MMSAAPYGIDIRLKSAREGWVKVIVYRDCYYSNFIFCPFKVVYSEALQAQSNRIVLWPEKNRADCPFGMRCSITQCQFQVTGPATEKVQCWPCV